MQMKYNIVACVIFFCYTRFVYGVYIMAKKYFNKNMTELSAILNRDVIFIRIDRNRLSAQVIGKSQVVTVIAGSRIIRIENRNIAKNCRNPVAASQLRRKTRYRVQHYRWHVSAVEDSQHALGISAVEHRDVPSGVRITVRFSHARYRRRVLQQRLAGLPSVSHGVPR